ACSSPSRRSRMPRLASRTECVSRRIPWRPRPACCWLPWGRPRCRPGPPAPPPVPLGPTWEPFTWRNGFVQIVFSEVPCNWFQCQENSIDPVHFEWLHSNWTRVLQGDKGPKPPPHLKIGFEEFEYGFVYRRVLEGQSESDELWTVGRTCLWPNCLFTGGHFEWRVPIDDENMLSVGWFFD